MLCVARLQYGIHYDIVNPAQSSDRNVTWALVSVSFENAAVPHTASPILSHFATDGRLRSEGELQLSNEGQLEWRGKPSQGKGQVLKSVKTSVS